jgi:hypothetical protein
MSRNSLAASRQRPSRVSFTRTVLSRILEAIGMWLGLVVEIPLPFLKGNAIGVEPPRIFSCGVGAAAGFCRCSLSKTAAVVITWLAPLVVGPPSEGRARSSWSL